MKLSYRKNVKEFGSSMLFNFVLVWLYNYFDLSVTDESYVDETCVWRINYNPGTFDNYLQP